MSDCRLYVFCFQVVEDALGDMKVLSEELDTEKKNLVKALSTHTKVRLNHLELFLFMFY